MNPRPLSNMEYVSFMDSVDPDSLSIPQWGSIVGWDGRYVLAFKRPDGQWALTDVTGGIPWRDQMIPIAAVLAEMPVHYEGPTALYSLGVSFGDTVARAAAALGYVIGWTAVEVNAAVQAVATSVGQAAGGILAPTVSSLTVPLIAIGIAALIIYLPKPRSA